VPAQPTCEGLKKKVGKLEEELRERKAHIADLQHRVAELERIYKELSQFAHRITRDLEEPLGAVRRYLQFVDARYKDRIDPDAAAFIDSAVDGADRMQGLIAEFLTYLQQSESDGDTVEPAK
jgi:chemotaxis family two-component system sensor kinase Cph1